MRKQKKIMCLGLAVLTAAALLAGCGNAGRSSEEGSQTGSTNSAGSTIIEGENAESLNNGAVGNTTDNAGSRNEDQADSGQTDRVTELTVRFGDNGEPFTMHLYENDTAAAIAGYVGQSAWRLPIYHYDDYDNWEVMQYYDIPSRYEIPETPEEITSVKAGEVYYSEPNRIILFYHDAEISAEYTSVGYFDATDEFVEAVEENPVLEGWGNKIVQIEQ